MIAIPQPAGRARGFTIIEMLMVVSIMVAFMAAAGFGVQSTWRSQQVAASAAMLAQEFALARTLAIKRNQPVQVAIYRTKDEFTTTGKPQYRAFQILALSSGGVGYGGVLTEMRRFESTIVMSGFERFSSVVVLDTTSGGGGGSSGSYSAVVIEFRPDGTMALDPDPQKPWTITLIPDSYAEEPDKLPKDFRSLVLNPESGSVTVH